MSVDLRTRYLGLELRSPIVASAVAAQRRAGDGACASSARASAAIVLPSLFEEEILAEELELNRSLEAGDRPVRRGPRLLPGDPLVHRRVGPLPRLARAGQGPGGRPGHRQPERHHDRGLGPLRAARSQDAGADALELNLYHVAADPRRTAADIEAADLALIASVRAAVTIPLAVKLSPYYSAMANFATAVAAAGADGLVLFNRFYQPDLDLEIGRGGPQARAQPAGRSCASRCAGSPSSGRSWARASRLPPRPGVQAANGRGQGADGRG